MDVGVGDLVERTFYFTRDSITKVYSKKNIVLIAFKVVVTYPNKKPAKNVPMLISATGRQEDIKIELKREEDRDLNVMDLTDEHGEAEFVIDACKHCKHIFITV